MHVLLHPENKEAQIALTGVFRLSALLVLVSLIFLLTELHELFVRLVCWEIKHSYTMLIKAGNPYV